MSVWITNPFERFGKYFRKQKEYRSCGCTLEGVKNPNHQAEIVGIIIQNGSTHYHILWCQKTFRFWGGGQHYVHDNSVPIAHGLLTEIEKTQARIIRTTIRKSKGCEKCGDTFSEDHHWAPGRLFGWGEFGRGWPTSYLCQECHRLWHRTVKARKVIARPQDRLEQVTEFCDRCECSYEVGVYLHHWAPKQLFADWQEWPTSNLCMDCIIEWRSVMLHDQKQEIVDPRVEALVKEQCGVEEEEEVDFSIPCKLHPFAAYLIAMEADLEERNRMSS